MTIGELLFVAILIAIDWRLGLLLVMLNAVMS